MSNQTIWTGKANNQWSNTANWTSGIPSFGIHAFVPRMDEETSYPVIDKNLKVNFTLKNEGKIVIESELYIQKNGIFQNYGIVKNDNIGTVVNEGNIMNFEEWINEGTCDNKRIFTNNHRFFNEGLIENHNTFVNLGSLVNTGFIDNHMVINNAGSLENFNIIENHGSAQVLDEGFFPEGFNNNISKNKMDIDLKKPVFNYISNK